MQTVGNGDTDVEKPSCAGLLSVTNHKLADRSAFGNPRDDERIRTDDDRRGDVANEDVRAPGLRQRLSANLKLATRDGSLRSHFRDLRLVVRIFPFCHEEDREGL